MNLIAENIFSFLDETSLRNCESVSKCWYFVIRYGKVWKHLYHKVSIRKPLLKTLLQLSESETEDKDEMGNDEFKFKKVFSAPQQICKNWSGGKYKTSTTNLGQLKVSVFTMDARRIIFGVNSSVPPSIMVWNRWTLEPECLLVGTIRARISHLIIHEELIFCSHSNGKIVIWDLLTKRTIMHIHDEVPEWVYWVDLHVAHGQLVIGYNIHPDDDDVDGEDYTYITIRRICDPLTNMEVENKEHIPNGTICHLASDKNYFVLFLESDEFVKFQLRSPSNFQIIREINILSEVRFAYNSGRLVTVNLEERQIKVWDSETLTVKQRWSITRNCGVQELFLTSSHILFLASTDDTHQLIVWDLTFTGDDISVTKQAENGLFQCILSSEELDALDNCALLFNFDELQILTVSFNNVSPTSLQSVLTRRDFVTRN